jgi:hypothetical protein
MLVMMNLPAAQAPPPKIISPAIATTTVTIERLVQRILPPIPRG